MGVDRPRGEAAIRRRALTALGGQAVFPTGRSPEECFRLVERTARSARVAYQRTGPATFALGLIDSWPWWPMLRGELDPDGTARAYAAWPGRLFGFVARLGIPAAVFLVLGEGSLWMLPPAAILAGLATTLAYQWVRMFRCATVVRRALRPSR